MKEYTFELKNNSNTAKTLALLTANFDTFNPFKNQAKGQVTKTTSADGEVTIAHGLRDKDGNKVTPVAAFANVQGDNVYSASVISMDADNITVLVKDMGGTSPGDDLVSTSVTLDYLAISDKREKVYNDASEISDAGFGADLAADDGEIFRDAGGAFEVISADSEKPYRTFLREVRQNLNRLVRIRMSANDTAAFSEYLILQKALMLDSESRKKKYLLENFRGLDQNVASSVIINLDYPIDSETLATLPVRSGHELKITYYFE